MRTLNSFSSINTRLSTNMVQPIKDSFLDLERHRQLLEDNIAKLRKSLQHWQNWEAEYEGFKEEILATKPLPEREQLLAIGRQYEGDLLTGKEIDDLLGNLDRTAAQVVNLLDRRIDYVEQNIQTIEKQIATMEEKLAVATVISTPDIRNEEGLPLTEIIEELDDEGNIISSHTSTPGSAKPQLLEVLKKAGVKDLPVDTIPAQSSSLESADVPTAIKKGVTFAPDTKTGPEPEKSHTAKRLEEIMKLAKQQESIPAEAPVIPNDESPEDAALRRQMLQYGMSEVGAVVAELNLEDGSDWSGDDFDEGNATSSDDEDTFGRSTGRIMDDELRQRMIELEERLGARVMENIGNKASDYDIVDEGIGRVTIKDSADSEKSDVTSNEPLAESTNESANSAKKSVRFSEDLDISPSPKPAHISSNTPSTKKLAAPVSDIIERVAPAASTNSAQMTPKTKSSRFKANRSVPKATSESDSNRDSGPSQSLPSTGSTYLNPSAPLQFSLADDRTSVAPTGPEGKTLASTVIERDVPLNASVAEPDELDPQLLNQEVATEYYKMRNRMIQRQGGFMKEEENEIIPFTEEEGGPRKMSRFKAARLARA